MMKSAQPEPAFNAMKESKMAMRSEMKMDMMCDAYDDNSLDDLRDLESEDLSADMCMAMPPTAPMA